MSLQATSTNCPIIYEISRAFSKRTPWNTLCIRVCVFYDICFWCRYFVSTFRNACHTKFNTEVQGLTIDLLLHIFPCTHAYFRKSIFFILNGRNAYLHYRTVWRAWLLLLNTFFKYFYFIIWLTINKCIYIVYSNLGQHV